MRISSATSIVLLLCALIYFIVPVPIQLNTARNNKERQKLIDFSLFKNKAYAVWVAGVALVEFGFYIPYVHLVREVNRIELDKNLREREREREREYI